MHGRAWFIVLLVLGAAAAAGCAQKKAEPTPTPPTTPTTTAATNTTTSTPTTTPPPPAAQRFKGIIKYGNPNDPDRTFQVENGTTRLDIKVWVNGTGTYSVSGPGTPPGDPYVEFKDKAGNSEKLTYTGASGTAVGGSNNIATLQRSLDAPAAGDWTVGVRGSGTNVQADVLVVAKYT